MSLYACPSPCKVTICSLRISVNDELSPHGMDVETHINNATTIPTATDQPALHLTIALFTAILEQSNLSAMSLYVCPSPCKVTICSLRTSVNDELSPHGMDVETHINNVTTIPTAKDQPACTLTIVLYTTMLEENNLDAMSFSVYPFQCKLTISPLRNSVNDNWMTSKP